MKIIGIIGTRKRDSFEALKKVKEKFLEIYKEGDSICSGGCAKGGDRFAEVIAKENGIPIVIFYPDYKKFGRGAPFVRNSIVAERSHVIIACIVKPEDGLDNVLKRKTGGTEDTIRKFVKHKEKQGIIPEIYLV